jgi:hypothetical protein
MPQAFTGLKDPFGVIPAGGIPNSIETRSLLNGHELRSQLVVEV